MGLISSPSVLLLIQVRPLHAITHTEDSVTY